MKMQCPEHFGSFTFNDVSFSPDEEGFIEVPEEAVSMALSHGITFLKETPEQLEKDAEGMKIHEHSDEKRVEETAPEEKAAPAQEGEAENPADPAAPVAEPEKQPAEEAKPDEQKAEATDAQPAQEGEATHA